jgi:hypothetical protein
VGSSLDDMVNMMNGTANRPADAGLAASWRDQCAPRRARATKVTVDFANAPKGTRVKTDPTSTADVDLSTLGYQMGRLSP